MDLKKTEEILRASRTSNLSDPVDSMLSHIAREKIDAERVANLEEVVAQLIETNNKISKELVAFGNFFYMFTGILFSASPAIKEAYANSISRVMEAEEQLQWLADHPELKQWLEGLAKVAQSPDFEKSSLDQRPSWLKVVPTTKDQDQET